MRTEQPGVDRFFRVLVEEIRATAPALLQNSFTVAEIYQSLIPYRTHRDRLGVEINGDYEDALLRLLGGEGDYLILGSEPARTRIRRELEHSNPDTGLYRDFAAVDVRLNPDKVEASGASDGPRHDDGPLFGARGGDETANAAPDRADPEPDRSSSTGNAPSVPERCPACEADLPRRDSLRFCPECGTNVLVAQCTGCGEELEWGWKYCVACGTPT